MNICFLALLHSQTAAVDSGKESYVQPLLDWLQEIHHQMMSDVVAAEREVIFVIGPGTFHQLRLESLLLEKTLLEGDEDRSFAREANVADANVFGVNGGGGGFFTRAAQKQSAAAECEDKSCK